MYNFLHKYSLLLIVAGLLNSCDGEVLFRTSPCEEGTVRQGNACVSESESAAGSGSKTLGGTTNCKNADLNKVAKGETITMCDGSLGEGKLVVPADCKEDGEQNCVNKSNFKAIDFSKLDSSKIVSGASIGGITGSFKGAKQCRNYSALATFDASYPPSNLGWNAITFNPVSVSVGSDQMIVGSGHGLRDNHPVRFTSTGTLPAPLVAGTTYYAIYVSNTTVQVAAVQNGSAIDLTSQGTGTHTSHDALDGTARYYDTIDDRNNGLAFSPANNPWSTSDYLCDASNFVNVSSASSPLLPTGATPPTGNQPFTQIWQDQISGMYVSNVLWTGGGRDWSDAIRTCEFINGSTAGDGWHLPTQKELMQLYINGISKVSIAGFSFAGFWSSSALSNGTQYAWLVTLATGTTDGYLKSSNIYSVLCVR